ncbi:MAG: c-type cytochrome [Rhodospirillaceae bacterium]
MTRPDFQPAFRPAFPTIVAVLAGLALAGGLPPPAKAAEKAASLMPEGKDIVAYRRALMITLNEQSGALGMILSSSIPDGDPAPHLEAIALAASYATKAFAPKVPGGEARPEIWSKWDDFSRRMDDFARKTAAAAKIAGENGPKEGPAKILGALTCKACHDLYRDETKR